MDLADFKPGNPGLPCSVARALDALSPKDRKVLEAALADPSIRHTAIERVLAREGFRCGQQVGRHRRGECRCGR